MKNRKLIIMILNCIMIITAITFVIMFGISGYGRPQGPQHISLYDFNYIYSAGKEWLSGLNPYVGGLPYPPNSSSLFMLLSVTDLQTSRILFIMINIFCIMVFVYLCMKLYNFENKNKQFFLFDFKSSLLIAMIVGNVFIVNILWTGQTTILFSTALLASYYFYIRSYDIRSGILLAIALIKPQLAYTFLLWLLLEKKWKTLATAIISTAILGIVPIYNRGIITAVQDWTNNLNNYVQSLHSEHLWVLFGLKPLLLDFEIRTNSLIIFACSMVLVILIHQFHKDISKLKLLGILTIIGLLLGQAGQYDVLIIASLLPYYFINISNKDFNKIILLCLMFIIINFPRKLLLLSDCRILHHHREIILIIVLFFLLFRREEQPISSY
ncbi:MAG: glycosyltransferase 87 family protein [Smithellaceae bacterium]|nr:glycosyltransferase 87 family protein [Smithellaceae bacterium]